MRLEILSSCRRSSVDLRCLAGAIIGIDHLAVDVRLSCAFLLRARLFQVFAQRFFFVSTSSTQVRSREPSGTPLLP